MADKMKLIYVEKTGHAVGIATQTSNPDGKVQAQDLVGAGLPIRNAGTGSVQLTVESKWLKVDVFDLVTDALLQYESYIVKNSQPVFQQKSLDPNATPKPIVLTNSEITVNSPSIIKKEDVVWIQIEKSSGERVVRDTKGDDVTMQVKIGVALQAGSYQVLALVPGFRPFIFQGSI